MVIGFLKKEGFDYISNFYRHKLFDEKTNHYLITTDDGNSLFLNKSSFIQLKKGRIQDESVFNILENKGVIVTPNNFNNLVEKTKKRYSFLAGGTSLHIVVPTHRCNMNCIYCFAESNPINSKNTDMDEETAIKIVEFIMKSPSRAITIEFQGGEPMVGFDKIKIMVEKAHELNKIYKKDLKLALVTNFTLMTEEKVNWLIENNVSFCTSLDGPKTVHDKNRFILGKDDKNYGTYDKVVYWIDRINQIYEEKNINKNVNALMTITRSSLPFYKEIIDEYVKRKIYVVNIRPLTKIGRAQENKEDIYYSEKEFIDFYGKSLKYIDNLILNGTFVIDRIRDLFTIKIMENRPGNHVDYESPCGAATGNIVYFTDGSIYTCNEALGKDEFKLGTINDKWQDIFKRKETSAAVLNSMLENNVICDRCIYKPYCGTCQVENLANFGKFNFYPSKTSRCAQTKFHSNNFFNTVFNELKKELNLK